MSGRRHSDSHNSYYSEPIVLERDPQVRSTYRIIRPTRPKKDRLTIGSKIYNLFRTRRKKVQVVEESPIRSRRQQRRIRTPSPSPSPPPPPSPPRGLYRKMTTRLDEDDIFAPLPPLLPPKSKSKYRHEDDYEPIIEERKPQRYRKVKVVYSHPRDEDAHPKVESPTSPHKKRDSGKYYVETRVDDRPSSAWSEFDHRRGDDEVVRRLTSDFNSMLAKERKERIEAERAAAVAQEKANRLEADLAHEQRQRSLEQRERAAADRERRLTNERDRLVEVRRPVVIHNPIAAVAPTHDNHRSALDRAQDDYRRLEGRNDHGVREEHRPSTSERRPRRQNIVVVDSSRDHRDRGHGHR